MGKRVRVLVCHASVRKRNAVSAALATDSSFELVGQAGDSKVAVACALELSPDVVLLDIDLPPSGGIAVTREIRSHLPDVRLLALLADENAETVIRIIAAGASGYVIKRSSPVELCQAIAKIVASPYLDTRLFPNALDSAVHLFRMERELSRGVVGALAAAIDERDGITSDHVHRVAQLSRILTERVAPELLLDLHADYGPLLHDIGKLAVSDAILLKPGPLTQRQQAAMRCHVEIGVRILEPIPAFESVRELVECHHEHWNGGGYPRGLHGKQIPLAARLFSICDAFDAMTSDRPYRKALGEAAALAELEAQAGRQFDPKLVEQFLELAAAGRLRTTPQGGLEDELLELAAVKRQRRASGSIRVHVVDDETIVRAWVRDALEHSEFEVDGEAGTADEAELLCREHTADIIVINQRLGPALGTDLLRTLRQQGVLAQALITSANEVQGLNELAREAGAQGAIHVLARPERLLAALREIVAGRESFDHDHPRRPAGQRNLSPRERDVLEHVALGRTNREIGKKLGISVETVNTMLDRVRSKLGVHRRAEAVVEARKLAMIP